MDPAGVETNIVYFGVSSSIAGGAAAVCERLSEAGVLMLPLDPHRIRAVTHLDVASEGVARSLEALSSIPVS